MMDEYLNENDKKKPEDVLLLMKAKLQKFQEDPLGANWINLNMDRDMVYANLIDDKKRSDLLDMSVLKGLILTAFSINMRIKICITNICLRKEGSFFRNI